MAKKKSVERKDLSEQIPDRDEIIEQLRMNQQERRALRALLRLSIRLRGQELTPEEEMDRINKLAEKK